MRRMTSLMDPDPHTPRARDAGIVSTALFAVAVLALAHCTAGCTGSAPTAEDIRVHSLPGGTCVAVYTRDLGTNASVAAMVPVACPLGVAAPYPAPSLTEAVRALPPEYRPAR